MCATAWLRWPRIAWLILLPLAVGGVVVTKEIGRRERAAQERHRQAFAAGRTLGQSQLKTLDSLYKQHRVGVEAPGVEWTMQEVLNALPAARGATRVKFKTASGKTREELSFVDPDSFWHFQLNFEDDRWTGLSAGSGGTNAMRQSGGMRAWLRVRSLLFAPVACAWAGLVVAAFVWRRGRVALLHASVMAGVVLIALAEAHPGYRWFSTSNDNLWVSVAAVAVIAVLFAFARGAEEEQRRKTVAERRCFVCGYDLRASPRRCPECGTPVPALPPRVGNPAAASVYSVQESGG